MIHIGQTEQTALDYKFHVPNHPCMSLYILYTYMYIVTKVNSLKLYDNFLLFTYVTVACENIWLSHGVLNSLSFLHSYDLHVEPNIFLCSLPTQWICTFYIFLLLLHLLYVKGGGGWCTWLMMRNKDWVTFAFYFGLSTSVTAIFSRLDVICNVKCMGFLLEPGFFLLAAFFVELLVWPLVCHNM